MSVNEREEAIMQEEKMHRSTYRVLKIFELLSATSEGMSLTGLAQKLEIPKGSLHPILKTMQAMNFIRMNDNGNYTIGQAAYFVGSSYTKNSDLLQEIDYVLKNLSSAVNQTAYFSVLSGGVGFISFGRKSSDPHHDPGKKRIQISGICNRYWKSPA